MHTLPRGSTIHAHTASVWCKNDNDSRSNLSYRETLSYQHLNNRIHLLVHVVDEIAIPGIAHSRWMFFLERFLKTLKGLVRQRARPEGSIAKGWLMQESLVYISKFLSRRDPQMHVL